ncbi:hypothetical protein PV11_10172 [Exophiala sideris]|uniref:Uncharacterized protein n=1 Tax=Exophiala sideris TaxID=1016849 RepID=A0A0D1YUB1_9EURO|nr:hypothetical protein PV11_10172 [Exophiala sideris]
MVKSKATFSWPGLRTALAKPPPERRDGKIRFDSLQPTIQIWPKRNGSIQYLVYIGHQSGSQTDKDLVWAHVRTNLDQFAVYFTKDEKSLTGNEFFTKPYTLAKWLEELLNQVSAQNPKAWKQWEVKKEFVREVIRLVLEDCVGDDMLLGPSYGSKSLRQVNTTYVGQFSRDLIRSTPHLRPRYYDPSYPANQSGLVVIKEDDSPESSVPGGSVARISSSLPAEPEPEDARLEAPNVTTDDTAVLAETERMIICPAKEKAIDMIEQDVKDWYEGRIDEDTLEKVFQERLSDVRLARKMQDTLIGSKGAGQNSRKRKADEVDDGDSA